MARVRTPKGDDFNVPVLRGQLFVCEGCCCGDREKGAPPVPHDLYHAEWERRRLRAKVHLTFTACLGPCVVANVVYLQMDGRSLWFHSLDDDPRLTGMLFDHIERVLKERAFPALPPELERRRLRRFASELRTTHMALSPTATGC